MYDEVLNMIEKFTSWAEREGWVIKLSDMVLEVPEAIRERYEIIPEQWLSFISKFSYISNAEQNMWFLTCNDYLDSCYDFENISLEAAIGDDEWIQDIKSFWNSTFPIIMSVGGDYHYYAIDIDSGKVVEGWEPEFEETTDVAESFDEFIEKIISGDIVLVV